METNSSALDRQRFPALAASFRRAKRIGTVDALDRLRRDDAVPPPPPPDPERKYAEVEELTAAFRAELARKHRDVTRETRVLRKELQRAWCPIDPEAPIGVPAQVLEDRDLLAIPSSELNPNLLGFSSALVTRDGEVIGGVDATRAWVDLMWAAERKIRWHDGRDRGQANRFGQIRSCGSRVITPNCSMCHHDGKPILEGCGVARMCARCSLAKAQQRRARFGRGRGRTLTRSWRVGLVKTKRQNGRFTEKMLTLTVPHVMRADCTGDVLEHARDDVHARVLAAYLAWPVFLGKVNYHLSGEREDRASIALYKEAEKLGAWSRAGARRFKKAKKLARVAAGRRRDRPFITHHRAFEWTAGADGLGHPHFHIHLWSTFLPGERLHAWWAEALRAVGVPIGKTRCKRSTLTMRAGQMVDSVVTELRMLRGFNYHAICELMKGGKRSALELSRLDFEHGSASVASVGLSGAVFRKGPGVDAFNYAEGWTIADVQEMCSPEIVSKLYMALEARRLSQASRGFFGDDPPCACKTCGASAFTVSFQSVATLDSTHPLACPKHERGPPP